MIWKGYWSRSISKWSWTGLQWVNTLHEMITSIISTFKNDHIDEFILLQWVLHETSVVASKVSSTVPKLRLGRRHWKFTRHLAVFLVIQQKQQLLDVPILHKRYKIIIADVFDIGLDWTFRISHYLFGINLLFIIVLWKNKSMKVSIWAKRAKRAKWVASIDNYLHQSSHHLVLDDYRT